MSVWQRLGLAVAALTAFYGALLGLPVALEIQREPEAWMGTGDPDAVFGWLFISLVGCGMAVLVGVLGLIAAALGTKSRAGGLWLLLVPGVLGVLTAVGSIVIVSLLHRDPVLAAAIAAATGVAPLAAMMIGISVRRRARLTAAS